MFREFIGYWFYDVSLDLILYIEREYDFFWMGWYLLICKRIWIGFGFGKDLVKIFERN